MPEKEYILFCDESDRHGKYYSNFYGGILVGASQYERVTNRLNEKKLELHLRGEAKWSKVTEQYVEKYHQLIKDFFEEISNGNLRLRIMFRQNAHISRSLRRDQVELEYFLLYYQFIKHAYGLEYAPENLRLRLYFDTFPDTSERGEQFKGFLLGLTKTKRWKSIIIKPEDITEVRSHEHVLLQCLDIVLGAMSFRLNDKHKEKLPGSSHRGKRTIAKEKLYKTILEEIQKIHPRFNISVSTRINDDFSRRWRDPYLHWSCVADNSVFDSALTKPRIKKKNPI